MVNTWLIGSEETILFGVENVLYCWYECARRQIEIGASFADTERKLAKKYFFASYKKKKSYQRVKS